MAQFKLLQNGNVGIGQLNPQYKLDVNGSVNLNGTVFFPWGTWNNLGRVGIGTTLPQNMLDVDGGVAVGAGYSAAYPAPNNGMIIQGNVGIGTQNPRATLEVNGDIDNTTPQPLFGYLNEKGAGVANFNLTFPISIRASQGIWCQAYMAMSDIRIKNIISKSKSQEDLDMLNKLEVTDYTYIDVVNKGNRSHKKLIAQQVKEVYPLAVNSGTDFIPDVYELSTSTKYNKKNQKLKITTKKKHNFKIQDNIRIIDDKGAKEVKVIEVFDENTFAIHSDKEIEKVFVYGKQVNDFLSIDYDAISMLNVSATQELAKRIKVLESENAELKAKLQKMENRVTQFEESMKEFKQLLSNKKEVFDNQKNISKK
jgi:uncharacterized small protein (DUF1192 family)